MENPIIEKHLTSLRATTEYRLLMQSIAQVCREDSEGLASAADSVVRGVARDVSSCSATDKLIIFHLMITPKS